MPSAIVSLLPPAQDLVYAHHGNGKPGGRVALDDGGNDTACRGTSMSNRVFNNPWPSYRFASLSDAMLAYQRGAAIAKPQLPEPTPPVSRTSSRAPSRSTTLNSVNSGPSKGTKGPSKNVSRSTTQDDDTPLVNLRASPPQHTRSVSTSTIQSSSSHDSASTAEPSRPLISHTRSTSDSRVHDTAGSWLKPDEPEDAAEEDDEDSQDGYEDDSFSFMHPPGEPVKGYVRPSFSRILTLDDEDDWREPPICVERPRWSRGGTVPLVTWLGHAGALLQIPWSNKSSREETTPYCSIIFDPIFSYRCSPSQVVGPARYLDPPCSVAELPAIHVCCISHDHYDHLDYQTILDLWECNMDTIHFLVPLGLASWFVSCGIPEERITELDWWHEAIMTFPATVDTQGTVTRYPPEHEAARIDPSAALTLKFACTPAQHRSGRGLFDHMTSLWASWCVGVVGEGREAAALRPGMKGWDDFKVYFGGDTGYRYATAADEGDDSAVCPAFAQIAERYGPFTLAMLPLSTGSSLPFLRSLLSLSLDQYTLTSSQHCSPADSMDIHLTLGAKRSLGIHWGTFCDAAEARATRVEFGRARREKGVSNDWDNSGDKGAFVVADIGLVMEIL